MPVSPKQPHPVRKLRALPTGARSMRLGIPNFGDHVFKVICIAAGLTILLLAALLFAVVFQHSWLAIQSNGWQFLTSTDWDPEPDHRKFGALAFIYGTLMTSALAMLVAVPLGVGTAAYLSEIAPSWLRRTGSFFVEMLAAIPSVVYGLWGMFVLAPIVQSLVTAVGGPNTGGRGILVASAVLAIMIVPYVTAVSYDICRAVPDSQRQAALALGATRWQTIWKAVLPYARPGIVAASFLALGRALGETMAVTMLIGNKEEISLSPFALGDSIASRIANQFTEATYDQFRSSLMELGLVLLLVTTVVNSAARLLIWRMGKSKSDVSRKRQTMSWLSRLWGRRKLGYAGVPLNGAPFALPPAHKSSARWIDQVMTGVLGLCLLCTVGPLFFILSYLLYRGVGALDWNFFTQVHVPVGEEGGGMAHALYGSAMLVGLATLGAVPIGLLAAIYLAEYRNGRLAHALRFVAELMAGVPSIVVGIFTYHTVVLPMMKFTDHRITFSGWAGAFALGFMMIPIVMRASEEALKLVPKTLRNASMALGANHWRTILRITVPAALPAIITAVFLAIARIAGETAPLLLTAGENRDFPASPSEPVPSVPVLIFKYSVSPYPDWHRKAWAAALVLLIVVMLLNFGVRFLTGKRQIMASKAD